MFNIWEICFIFFEKVYVNHFPLLGDLTIEAFSLENQVIYLVKSMHGKHLPSIVARSAIVCHTLYVWCRFLCASITYDCNEMREIVRRRKKKSMLFTCEQWHERVTYTTSNTHSPKMFLAFYLDSRWCITSSAASGFIKQRTVVSIATLTCFVFCIFPNGILWSILILKQA